MRKFSKTRLKFNVLIVQSKEAEVLYKRSWSYKFCNIHRKTPVLESLCWRPATLLIRDSNTGFSCGYYKIFKTPILKIICEHRLLKVKLNLSKVWESSRVWPKLIGNFFSKYCSCLNGCFWRCNTLKHSSNDVASLRFTKNLAFPSDYFWDS